MSDKNELPAWMSDELVQDIPREKLDFLNKMFTEANNCRQSSLENKKDQRKVMLHLMPLLKEAKAANLGLTPQELQAAIAAIRKHSTSAELGEIDKILAKSKQPKL